LTIAWPPTPSQLVILGDFNDTKDSASTKAVIGRGKLKLVEYAPR